MSSLEDRAPSDFQQAATKKQGLSVWDTISIIVGIVIGAGIFETAPLVFSTLDHAGLALGAWLLGGLLSLIGAFCYAELASTYPNSGGDYVYLSKAYGPSMGFFFGWAQLSVILTGSIGMMAFIFAEYAATFWNLDRSYAYIYAALAVAVLTAINILGLSHSKHTQNFLSSAKILGLALVVFAGIAAMFQGQGGLTLEFDKVVPAYQENGLSGLWGPLGLAMVFVLYSFGGWSDAAYVASEVKNRKRNIPKALILGTLAITLIYLVVNLAFLAGLGTEQVKTTAAIATDILRHSVGDFGADLVTILVMIAALGAVNGLIFTGSRVFSALGSDHMVFSKLSHWHPKFGSPIWSLITQAAITIGLIVIVGSSQGQGIIGGLFGLFGINAPMWDGAGGFDALLMCTAPVFWTFFFLTGLSVILLRYQNPKKPRPFSTPLYPLTPILFCLTSLFMLYQSAIYAGSLSLFGFLLLILGLPLYAWSLYKKSSHAKSLAELNQVGVFPKA